MSKDITVVIAEYKAATSKGAVVDTPYSSDRFKANTDNKLTVSELADLNIQRTDMPGSVAVNVLDKFDGNHNGVLDKADITKMVQAVDKKNHAAFEKICPKGTVKLSALIQLADDLNITQKDLNNLSPAAAPNVTLAHKGDQIVR